MRALNSIGMKFYPSFPIGVLLQWMLLFAGSPAVEAEQQGVEAQATVRVGEKDQAWRYLLHLPDSYEAGGEKKWPLLFFLHGSSLRGDDLEALKRYGPPQFLDKKPDFPFIVVSPQLPAGGWPADSLKKLLDEVLSEYRVDPDQVCLTGTSLGGGGAWNFAASAPGKFASLVPVCGYGDVSLARKLKELPIWGFHGDADLIVSITPHRKLIDAVNAAGGNARLTVIPGGTHGDVIVPTYDKEALYEWILKQRRGQ